MHNVAAKANAEFTVLPDASSAGDIGGPVAAIHRMIRERLHEEGTFEIVIDRAPEGAVDRLIADLSRCIGPIALGGGCLVVARLLLG